MESWLENYIKQYRACALQDNHVRAARGEIPVHQCGILADMAANQMRAWMYAALSVDTHG